MSDVDLIGVVGVDTLLEQFWDVIEVQSVSDKPKARFHFRGINRLNSWYMVFLTLEMGKMGV